MKTHLLRILTFLLCLILILPSCDTAIPQESGSDNEAISIENNETKANNITDHSHQWQDVTGEHARICTECNEKQLKSEACNFVRTFCDQPAECTICHATDSEAVEDHSWQTVSQDNGCWYSTTTYACSKCDMEQIIEADFEFPNHNWAEETADGKTTFFCTDCSESNTITNDIKKFSYAQILENFKIGDPGVKHDNFNICFESEVSSVIDAVTIAKLELTVEYDTISVSYDEELDVWGVDFWTLNMNGGGQSVYIKGNGLTCYIVYGE